MSEVGPGQGTCLRSTVDCAGGIHPHHRRSVLPSNGMAITARFTATTNMVAQSTSVCTPFALTAIAIVGDVPCSRQLNHWLF